MQPATENAPDRKLSLTEVLNDLVGDGVVGRAEADKLIEQGLAETDPAKRKAIYYRLQDIWQEEVPGIMLHQPIRQMYFRDWVKGYFFHPMENNPIGFKIFSKAY